MRKNKRHIGGLVLLAVVAATLSVVFCGCSDEPVAQQPAGSADKETASSAPAETTRAEAVVAEQTTCPVMEGSPIDKTIFVEYKGKRVYFCCKGCPERFLANPESYLAKLPQFKN